MPVTIRAFGRDFDVDRFCSSTYLHICQAFRRGEKARARQTVSEKSGVNISVSDADFDDLAGQIADTVLFLGTHTDAIRALRDFPGVEGVEVDFGIRRRDVYVQSDTFPAELVEIAGTLRIAVTLTQYPIGDMGDDA